MRSINLFTILILFFNSYSFSTTEYKATATYGGEQHDTGWICTSSEHACNTLFRLWVPQQYKDQYRSKGVYQDTTNCSYQDAASINSDGEVNWNYTSLRGVFETRSSPSCDFDNTEEDECPHPYYKYDDSDGIEVCTSPCEYFRFQNPNETHLTAFYPDSFLSDYGETEPVMYVCDYLIDGVACEFVRDLFTHIDSPEPGFLTDYNLTGNECQVGEWGDDNPGANPDPESTGGCTVVCFGNCEDICAEVDGDGVLDDFDGLSDPDHESVQDDPEIPIICYYIPTAPGCPGTSTDPNGDTGDGSGEGDGSGDSGSGTGTGTGSGDAGTGDTGTGTGSGDGGGTDIGDLDFGNAPFISPGIYSGTSITETNGLFFDRLSQSPVFLMSTAASVAWPSGGTCPTFEMNVFGSSVSSDIHCKVNNSVSSVLASVMTAVWVLLGITIILRA